MKTILAIDLGKRNSVFCKVSTSSLKPEYPTVKTDPQKFHDILFACILPFFTYNPVFEYSSSDKKWYMND